IAVGRLIGLVRVAAVATVRQGLERSGGERSFLAGIAGNLISGRRNDGRSEGWQRPRWRRGRRGERPAATPLQSGSARGPRRGRKPGGPTRITGLDLLRELLELRRERPDLRLERVEARTVRAAQTPARHRDAAHGRGRTPSVSRQRLERADDDMEINELLLELLDPLAQLAVTPVSRSALRRALCRWRPRWRRFLRRHRLDRSAWRQVLGERR